MYIPARARFLARKRRYNNDDNDEPEDSWIGPIIVAILIIVEALAKKGIYSTSLNDSTKV